MQERAELLGHDGPLTPGSVPLETGAAPTHHQSTVSLQTVSVLPGIPVRGKTKLTLGEFYASSESSASSKTTRMPRFTSNWVSSPKWDIQSKYTESDLKKSLICPIWGQSAAIWRNS